MIAWLLLACATPPPAALPEEEEVDTEVAASVLVPLDSPRLARRASLDLRGVLPSSEELAQVEADPAALDGLVEEWLEDPRLEDRLVLLLAERWLTRIDEYLISYEEYRSLAEDPTNEYAFQRGVGEEPLRLVAHVVAEDLPWSTVVTADWTMATPMLASLWPIAHPGGEGWQVSTYTDGRPAAGVLATTGLWWRYYTTISNDNRARVAAITRLLICEDYAARLVSFTEADALGEGSEVEDALRESPYCMGCHSAIDPIAATLFGFWPANEYDTDEVDVYHPDREALGPVLLGVSPAWYGDPVYGLNELGAHIAADPRYAPCAVQTFTGLLWRREPTLSDRAALMDLQAAFEAGDQRVKPLLAEIIQGEAYRAGGLTDVADDEAATREATLRLLTPQQLSSAVEALTGFHWSWEGFDQLDSDTLGFRVLAGGVDGDSITRPQESPGLTWSLTVQRLAEAAASHAVSLAVEGAAPPLLEGIDVESAPTEAWLGALFTTLTALEASDEQLADLAGLWTEVAATDDPSAAWVATLSALLADPAFVTE